MKFFLIICISIVLSFPKTEAQLFNYGIKGGVDIVYGKFLPSGYSLWENKRLSYDLGLLLSYSPIKLLSIQVESGFIEKGYKYKDQKVKFYHGYFSNQLVFIIKPFERLNFEIGSELSRLLYAKAENDQGKSYSYALSNYEKTQFSGIIGTNFRIFYKDWINLRFVYAFTPFLDTWNTSDQGLLYNFKVYESYFSIGLKHYFRKI